MTPGIPNVRLRIVSYSHNLKRWVDSLERAEVWFQVGMTTATERTKHSFTLSIPDPITGAITRARFSREQHAAEQDWRRDELRRAFEEFLQAYHDAREYAYAVQVEWPVSNHEPITERRTDPQEMEQYETIARCVDHRRAKANCSTCAIARRAKIRAK